MDGETAFADLKQPQVLREPPARGRVLVFAPHPDDESAGPGATLALHARAGDEVAVVFVTTGVHGDASGRHDPERYVAVRREEARAAAAVLGLAGTEFWEYPDSMEVTEADLDAVADRMVDALYRFAPDVIYAPHVRDAHRDHHHVARALARARARWGGAARAFSFEIWSPLEADYIVDVTDVYELKLAAIRCYASQLVDSDIERAIEGLNRFRASLMPHQRPGDARWAEVFAGEPPLGGPAPR